MIGKQKNYKEKYIPPDEYTELVKSTKTTNTKEKLVINAFNLNDVLNISFNDEIDATNSNYNKKVITKHIPIITIIEKDKTITTMSYNIDCYNELKYILEHQNFKNIFQNVMINEEASIEKLT